MNDKVLLKNLIEYLDDQVSDDVALEDLERQWRGLINQRQVETLTEAYLTLEDSYLSRKNASDVVDLSACEPTAFEHILIYKGDMIKLRVDALVNAANSELLGCFIPNHACLDNAIHTFAGARLRQACHQVMLQQGHKEPVGQVKVTDAYHLPARQIYHTVGPFIPKGKPVSPLRQGLLKQAYLSCLNQAKKDGVSSIAFPCLSTGEFGFPKDMASRISVETVRHFLATNPIELTVIFCLYTPEDELLYADLLKKS
ncbi:protein-ADP-ribose hydrolase [Streptococcus fryi]